jgi:transposase
MFANTPRGAESSAMIYSIIETAKKNGLNPLHYLTYLFEKLPNLIDTDDKNTLDWLLPWSSSIPIHCRVFNKKNT